MEGFLWTRDLPGVGNVTWGHPQALLALRAQPLSLTLLLPAEGSWQDEHAGPRWPRALLAPVHAGVGIKTSIAPFEGFGGGDLLGFAVSSLCLHFTLTLGLIHGTSQACGWKEHPELSSLLCRTSQQTPGEEQKCLAQKGSALGRLQGCREL